MCNTHRHSWQLLTTVRGARGLDLEADTASLLLQQRHLVSDLLAGVVVACGASVNASTAIGLQQQHAPSLQPSWMTALRSAICLSMLRMRRFGQRFKPWRRQIFFKTVGQMSVQPASALCCSSEVCEERTQDLRGLVDGPVKERRDTRDVCAAFCVSARAHRLAGAQRGLLVYSATPWVRGPLRAF